MNSTEGAATVEVFGSTSRFKVVDYIVFSAMLVISVAIGVHSALRGRGTSSTQEYLLGGRTMPILPVALSLLGGAISAISILGNATEMYFYGTQLVMNLGGCVVGTLVMRNILLPVLYPLNIISMFEYIEMRFKSQLLRKMATAIQLLASMVYVGICLYGPSLTLSSVTSLPIWASCLIMGFICSFYITIGGVKAVVYTDVVQTLIMFGGVLVVSVLCCVQLGGPGIVWTIADQGGRLEFFNMDTSPFVRHTFWSTQVLGMYVVLSMAGLNQPQFQRFVSVKNLKQSQSLCILFIVGLFMLWGVFYFSGLVAYAVYSDCDPLTSGRIEKPDQIIPYLVTDKLSHLVGMSGLFVASVYGGVLSSLSSHGNSIACIIWVDFLKERDYFKNISDRSATNFIRVLSSMTGVVAICMGLVVGKLGTIFQVAYSLLSAIKGPLSGIFLVGICAPWVNTKGATVGFTLAFLFNMWMVIGKFVTGSSTPKKLPLSTLGCPENLLNVTLSTTTTPTTITTSPESGSHTMYDISYCYNGITGVLNTFIISTLVSLCTGPMAPQDVEAKLVNATAARLYLWLWRLVKGHHHTATTTTPDKEAQAHMLSPLDLQTPME
ncbi:sodium-coupled monocarboxylate transporter 1-like [Homarus americanus]|uniref:Sodium-coupled monocarboxylate transporter 1-like 3 n=1 Tax=Homarus americanus TaxID=6706 RepID=A0A8J5N179_HOMAM|nr:sodium-coupled monocarboxylate transporter 1-like [Homarus americanus]KAG7170661.1 Sodium-coupled monocarboxylate transporter 1-like 3 [Homarus americanus]